MAPARLNILAGDVQEDEEHPDEGVVELSKDVVEPSPGAARCRTATRRTHRRRSANRSRRTRRRRDLGTLVAEGTPELVSLSVVVGESATKLATPVALERRVA